MITGSVRSRTLFTRLLLSSFPTGVLLCLALPLFFTPWCVGGVLDGEPCRLKAVPDEPPGRDRHTMLLAHFDDQESWDADYARVDPTEVGVDQRFAIEGRFGKAAAVTSDAQPDRLMYPALDNVKFQTGTLEFWAKSRAEEPIWTNGKQNWFVVLYPERSRMKARYGLAPHAITLRKTAENELEFKLTDHRISTYRGLNHLTRTDWGSWLRLPVAELEPSDWHHILVSWDLRGEGRLWLIVNGEGVTASLGRKKDALPPNPGIFILFGGYARIPSECGLDELRIQECTAESRLAGSDAEVRPDHGIDRQRLMQEEDLARAVLDKILELQFKGGMAAGYTWPNYGLGGWEFVGRGVDMWFGNSAWAGSALLRGWLIWGDERYLDGAIEAADMFCELQWENGSWAYHYTYSRGEFLPWGEAYIAQEMQSRQIRFLCLMYRRLGYERYEKAVRKAGDWLVAIQHPEGAWNWHAHPEGTTKPFGNYALNDAVTPQAMLDLYVVWCATGDDKYLQPILKGAEWILKAQAGPPTYAWADQYDKDFKMIWNRSTEPPAISSQAIGAAKKGLLLAYDLTGDDKYLRAIRQALNWMESVPRSEWGYLWYDPKSGKPVDADNFELRPANPEGRAARRWTNLNVREDLELRQQGPIYPDWRGTRPQAEFDRAPTVGEFAKYFKDDQRAVERKILLTWAAGKPRPGLVHSFGGSIERPPSLVSAHGRSFSISGAIGGCNSLMNNVECARVVLGDLDPETIPRYARRNGPDNWVYLDPPRNFCATPLSGR